MTGRANVISLSFWGDYGGEVLLKIVLALVVGGVLSVLGAIYPARRAGKMPPADAMRTEV
jgi:branched-subunit amino acid ABC-type transport system permease component